MKGRQISRGIFLRGAAGAAGLALAGGQLGSALAQATPEGLGSGRPINGRLAASTTGRTAEYAFDYPGGEVVYTVEMQMTPENVFSLAGFQVYNPTGSIHVKGGAQAGLVPNVAANVVSRQKGRYVVQVYNYSPDVAIGYSLRVVPGVREGEQGTVAVPSLATARQLPLVAYVGSYTEPAPRKGEGISVYYMDTTSGGWSLAQTAKGVRNPSFLALDPQQHFLYSVEEVNDVDDKKSGAVSAFSVDQSSGQLTWLNRQSSGGAHPAHLSVDPSGRFVLVANYTGGNVEVLPITVDGSLGAPTDLVAHSADLGLGPNSGRQEAPHPHMIPFDPGGRFVLVPDLGLDRTFVYRFNSNSGKLVANDPPFALASKPGSGPRHVAFHPGGSVAYVINELSSTIDVFGYDAARGALQLTQTVSTLPKGFDGMSTTAEVVVAPSGRFVYGSNRGHDSIAIFAADPATGMLTAVGWAPTGGQTPRNFNIDPTGSYLYAANQGTNNIWAFQIDQASGLLSPLGEIKTGSPVDIIFAV